MAEESLADLLGGRRAALDATVPAAGFLLGWLASGQSIWIGSGVAVLAALGVSAGGCAAATGPGRCCSGCWACVSPR